jgi:hypothetical protein
MSTSSIIDPFKTSDEIVDPFKSPSTDVLSQIPGGAKSAPGTYIDQVPKGPSVFERGLQAVGAVPVLAGGSRLAQLAIGAQRLGGPSTAAKVGSQLLSSMQPKTVGEAAKMAGGAFAAGATGGVAEQVAKAQGAGPVVTQLAGMTGEMIPGLVTYPVGRAIERAITPLVPSMRQGVAESLVRRLPETVREGGVPEVGATRQQRLAGAKAELEGGAGTGGAATVGRALEEKASESARSLTQQFDSSIRNIRDQALQDAETSVRRATQVAGQIRQRVRGQGQQAIAQAEAEATRIENEAAEAIKQEALRVRNQIDELKQRRDAAVAESERGMQEAQQGFGQFGERVTLSPIGQEARQPADKRRSELIAERSRVVKEDLDNIDKAIIAKGNASAGVGESASNLENFIKTKVGEGNVPGQIDPQRTPSLKQILADATGKQEKVNEAGQTFVVQKPVSYYTLEELRRKLRDRQYGDVEGYPAIGKIEAGQIADIIENMQREFVGSNVFDPYLRNYTIASKPINEFYSKIGRLLTEQTPFGERYITDAARLPSRIFDSQESVNLYTNLIGGDQNLVNNLAVKYLNDQMRGGTAQDVARAIDSNRDWLALDQFKGLRDQLTNLQASLSKAGAEATRLGAASKAAETEIGQLAERKVPTQTFPLPAAEQVRERGARTAKELEEAAVARITGYLQPRISAQQLAQQTSQARMTKEVEEARSGLTAKIAEIKNNLSFGEKNASDAFYQRLTGSNSQKEIQTMADAVKRVPEATDAFKSAVREALSRAPENKLMSMFDRNIEPALKSSGLYKPEELAEVRALVEAVDIAKNAVERAKIAASKAVGTMTPEAAFTDEIRKEVVKARKGQYTVAGVLGIGGALAGLGGQSLYTAIGVPATVGGIFGYQAVRGDYAPALRRAVAEIVSNPDELRRVLAAPERQRPGMIMTLARNVLAAETGSLVPEGETNAP